MRLILLCMLWLMALPGYGQSGPFRRTFVNQTELGVLIGRVVFGQPPYETTQNSVNLTAQTFNGIQLTPHLAAGATVGIDWYAGTMLMPLGGGVRYYIARKAEKQVRLYAGLDGGYATNWLVTNINNSHIRGGAFVSPSLGLRFGRPDRANLTLSLSYRYQEARAAYPTDGYWILRRDEARTYNRVALRLGVGF